MLSNSPIQNKYMNKTSSSQVLATKAAHYFPSGITHDSRHTTPYGIYVESAEGSRKHDVDGNEYVDYFGGHGALMLGHRNAEVETCIQKALSAGTHFGSSHQFEVAWLKRYKHFCLRPNAFASQPLGLRRPCWPCVLREPSRVGPELPDSALIFTAGMITWLLA